MQISIAFFFGLVAVVSAHFQLQFPTPRGVFVEDSEPNFCDGYTGATTNRTEFPLTGGFFSLNSEHPQWSIGVYLSTVANTTSFDDFKQVKPFFQDQGEGLFCLPLDFSVSANATGLQDGQNVTIQVLFNGGDGNLYQCADLTLSNNADISGNPCTNATGSSGNTGTVATGPSTAAVATGSSTAAGASPINAATRGSALTACAGAMLAVLVIVVSSI